MPDKKLTKPRIGIFGGLFDPPHAGHLIISQWVLQEHKLDKIIFVPAAHPPHKAKYSPYPIRYKMIALAIEGNKKFSISDIERKIPGKTYTVEVVKELKKRMNAELYLIIGADQWQEIKTWKSPVELFKQCKIIVMPRPNYAIKKPDKFRNRILISHSPLIDISSTMIRQMIKNKLDVRYLVAPEVAAYIKTKQLYCSPK